MDETNNERMDKIDETDTTSKINTHSLKLLYHTGNTDLALREKIYSPSKFGVRVPRPFLSRIRRKAPDDPLLRQVLPTRDEQHITKNCHLDPVKERAANKLPGLIHKYPNRVLLIASSECPIHCRYCFRRHFAYEENTLIHNLPRTIDYIHNNKHINEVILSGGDPLSLRDVEFFSLCEKIESIDHIHRIRIHTRYPVAVPKRLGKTWIAWSKNRTKQYILVTHINHPQEIDEEVRTVFTNLRHLTLLNQTVLLKGVNDNAKTLAQLSETCFQCGILPYYLHLLDPVQGGAHFRVGKKSACKIMRKLNTLLPGYLVPKLVRDEGNTLAKTVIPY